MREDSVICFSSVLAEWKVLSALLFWAFDFSPLNIEESKKIKFWSVSAKKKRWIILYHLTVLFLAHANKSWFLFECKFYVFGTLYMTHFIFVFYHQEDKIDKKYIKRWVGEY